jgi:hypothetical protein
LNSGLGIRTRSLSLHSHGERSMDNGAAVLPYDSPGPFKRKKGREAFNIIFILSLALWLYSPLDLGRFFSFLIYTQSVGLLGKGISPSQDRYLHTDNTNTINAHRYSCLE